MNDSASAVTELSRDISSEDGGVTAGCLFEDWAVLR